MNTHRGICNRLQWMQATYQLTVEDRVVQKTPFSFDVSVWEFFWPLLNGASLVLARPGGHQDSAYMVQLLAEQQITTVHFVPSLLQVVIEEPALASCQSLRRVICSGEVLPAALQTRFFARVAHGATQSVWPNRGRHRCDGVGLSTGGSAFYCVHWAADCQHARVCGGSLPAAGAGGGVRRTLGWRRWPGVGLSQPAGPDRGEICATSVESNAGDASLPDRGSRAVAAEWHAGVSGAAGYANQTAGLSD